MALSDTQIVNAAFARIGLERISDLSTDTSSKAQRARDIYEHAKRLLLESHLWNFATKRAQLTVSSTTPDFGYNYQYPLPGDFLRINKPDRLDVEYEIEGSMLLTDMNEWKMTYVADVDEGAMTASFQEALADQVAYDLALAFKLDKQLVQQRKAIAKDSMAEARYNDSSQQSTVHTFQSSKLLSARAGADRHNVDKFGPLA